MWIMLIIQLLIKLPDIFAVIKEIIEMIRKRPRSQRPALYDQLKSTLKKHVREDSNTETGAVFVTSEGDLKTELCCMLDELKAS